MNSIRQAFCVGITLLSSAPAWALDLSEQFDFHIAPQTLSAALIELSNQANVQILTAGKLSSATSPGASGHQSLEQALQHLLQGTGLTYRISGATSISIVPAAIDSVRSNDATAAADKLEEIVVTAQKREERQQDVPVPVTSISAATLTATNQLRLQDYFTAIPSLSVVPFSQSQQLISIRGITTGFGNPTVGIIVDDVPYGASTAAGVSYAVPDIDPGDLSRVEVLRGPQGTLYGSSSMGGLIKFVTIDPSTDRLSGRLEVGTSSVRNGAGLGYDTRGSVNVPLGDTVALRASAFTREDPGYIDNPVYHYNGVNEEHVSGGRVALLWRPFDSLSLKLGALYQHSRGDGQNDVDRVSGLGDLQQNYIPGTGADDRKTQSYAATVQAKFGSFDLTSVTGYSINQFSDSLDDSYNLGFVQQFGIDGTGFNGFGFAGAPVTNNNRTGKLTQELRLSTPIGNSIQWLIGGFYTHEDSQYVQDILAADPSNGAVVARGISFDAPTTFQEVAVFTDLTFNITDRFDVQLGGRESEIRQSFTQTDTGPEVVVFDGTDSPFVIPKTHVRNSAFTYLVTPRLRLSADLMLYARLASGYRAGGPNTAPGVPSQYNPDKTQNYELGLKGDFLDHILSVDASAYYIKWTSIQLALYNPEGLGYFANATGAKSQGVELSLQAKPLPGLTISLWGAFDDAVLTHDIQPGPFNPYGLAGNRLPDTSRVSGSLSVSQEFPLWDGVTGLLGATVSYVGNRQGLFGTGAPERQIYPAYARSDLRGGLRYGPWEANLFASNITDRRGLLYGGLGTTLPFAFQYIQPRTVGLSLARKFD